VTSGVLPARRIGCLPFYQADFDNWTAKGKVFPVQAMRACSGSGGVAPLILNHDTKLWRNNLIMRAGFASSPFYSCFGFVSRSSIEAVPAYCCHIADLFLSVMTSAWLWSVCGLGGGGVFFCTGHSQQPNLACLIKSWLDLKRVPCPKKRVSSRRNRRP